jgi:hypothetical protein
MVHEKNTVYDILQKSVLLKVKNINLGLIFEAYVVLCLLLD